jgi:hypothetical protein
MENTTCYICGDNFLEKNNNQQETNNNQHETNNNQHETNNNQHETNNNQHENNNNSNNTTKLKCGHYFHYSCIYISYKYTKDKKCPYCRQDGGLLNSSLLCTAILKSGKNKGNTCNCRIKKNALYCGKHIIK